MNTANAPKPADITAPIGSHNLDKIAAARTTEERVNTIMANGGTGYRLASPETPLCKTFAHLVSLGGKRVVTVQAVRAV